MPSWKYPFFDDGYIGTSYSDLEASYSAAFSKNLNWFPCNNHATISFSSAITFC